MCADQVCVVSNANVQFVEKEREKYKVNKFYIDIGKYD